MENTNIENIDVENLGPAGEAGVKTYTQEEVMALLQQEGDRRVSQALKKQQKEFDKKLSLSKLDDNERAKAEKDNRIAELEEPVLSVVCNEEMDGMGVDARTIKEVITANVFSHN